MTSRDSPDQTTNVSSERFGGYIQSCKIRGFVDLGLAVTSLMTTASSSGQLQVRTPRGLVGTPRSVSSEGTRGRSRGTLTAHGVRPGAEHRKHIEDPKERRLTFFRSRRVRVYQ